MSASLQQGKKNGQIAPAPLLGGNSGSSQAALDPMSPQNLAAAAVRQQVQASADTKYDPDMPPPVVTKEGFHSPSGGNMDRISLGISLVLTGIVALYVSMK